MLNPFFLQGSRNEQSLVQELINETIQIHGIDVYYLPRTYATEATVIREVIESEFNDSYPIEAYVNTFEGYGNQGTILSKFGIQELDDLTLTISRERFETYIAPLTKNKPNIKLSDRPKEGDLIWFPLGDKLFEIKYVEHEKPFYQLKKNYTYELTCSLFRIGDEVIDTGIDDIDDITIDTGFSLDLTLTGIGSTASAYTGIVNDGVRKVTLTNRGGGFTSTPSVLFSAAAGLGTAVGIATMIDGITDLCKPNPDKSRVQQVLLTNPGFGYTVAPEVAFVGGGGVGAAATTVIADGIVGVITVTSSGGGFTAPPTVTFSAPPAVGIVTAVVSNTVPAGPAVTFDDTFDSTVYSMDSTDLTFDSN